MRAALNAIFYPVRSGCRRDMLPHDLPPESTACRHFAHRRDDGTRVLRFGTGAGITWGSDAAGEWEETRLKAARLVGLAAGAAVPSGRL